MKSTQCRSGLESYRSEQEYERLKSRVAALEYEVARLRERLTDLEQDCDPEPIAHMWEDR